MSVGNFFFQPEKIICYIRYYDASNSLAVIQLHYNYIVFNDQLW